MEVEEEERTAEPLLEEAVLLEREPLLTEEERELLLPEVEEERLLELTEEERLLLEAEEEERVLLPEVELDRAAEPLLLLRLLSCCTAVLPEREELLLERELLLTLEDRVLDEELEEDRLLCWTPELRVLLPRELWVELLRELCWLELLLRELWVELLRVLWLLPLLRVPFVERVWATRSALTSMDRASVRVVANVKNLLITSQFLRLKKIVSVKGKGIIRANQALTRA